MNHQEIVTLIREGVGAQPADAIWADFGAGWGNFTRALRDLLGASAVIYAVDRDTNAFAALRQNHGEVGTLYTVTADFTQPITPPLPPLDGIVMANALHFVPYARQQATLALLHSTLKPGGRLVLVEYDFRLPRPWVPYPISNEKYPPLVTAAGFQNPQLMHRRHSPSTGAEIYASVAFRASLRV
jgi:SAM-dependent methyltransferase